MPAPLVDIGINLGHDSFEHDRDQVIHQAWDTGLVAMVLTGTSLDASLKAAALAATLPGRLFSTAGIHPHDAATFSTDSIDELKKLCNLEQVVAVGETGLDYYRDYSPRNRQLESFAAHLELAVDTRLPVFLHQRDAHEDFMPLLHEFRPRLLRGVVHCFTGTRAELYDYLDEDMYIGITGWICDERRGLHLRELVKDIPAERLLLETDSPYLLPRSIRPKPDSRRNVPANLRWVLEMVAACRQTRQEELAWQTTRNAGDFFGITSLL